MKNPLSTDSQDNTSYYYKDKFAWQVIDAEIEGSKIIRACAILEVAVNGILVAIGDGDDEEDY